MTDPSKFAQRSRSFDAAAAQYAAHRPSYPPALLDAVEELADRPLKGARVVDVGAGTGIATVLLHERGARVTAVEPGEGMAAEFRKRLPEVPVVLGDGNALPFADGSADLVTYAQAWHWTDPARALPEARRVLGPGGALALWWNVSDHAVGWVAAQDARIKALLGVTAGAHGTPDATRDALNGLGMVKRSVAWSRTVPVDLHLANLATHSVFLVLGTERTDAFLATEREELLRVFPDGAVTEPYHVDLLVARF